MALPIYTWAVLKDGYTFADSAVDVVTTQMRGAAPAFRKNVGNNPLMVMINSVLQGDEVDAFFTFFRTTLLMGTLPFQIALLIDTYELTDHTARFVPATLRQKWVSDTAMLISFQAEVKPLPYDVDEGLDRVGAYNEFGRNWRNIFPIWEDELDQVVNIDWPEAL